MQKHTSCPIEIGNEVILALLVETYLSILPTPTVSTINIRRPVRRMCTLRPVRIMISKCMLLTIGVTELITDIEVMVSNFVCDFFRLIKKRK